MKNNKTSPGEAMFIANIRIVFSAPIDPGAAEDKVSEILTGNLVLNNIISDWEYVSGPRLITKEEAEGFEWITKT